MKEAARVLALVGPTAVGKTAIAIEVAQALEAEIVSCDSMQVYQHMPILSQMPSTAQRRQVPHRLIDCVNPEAAFNVGTYHRLALPAIHRLLARGKRVLIVGGTGLYLKALTEGLCQAPPADQRVRDGLWTECRGVGSVRLHNRLQDVDSTAASRIHPNDARRIIRALEVYAVSGKPLSSWWARIDPGALQGRVAIIGLTRDRADLDDRITSRLLRMVYEDGVIPEARRLLRLQLSGTARQVHGLSDIETYLEGESSLKAMIESWQRRVRHYARRQLTWFRATPTIQWVEIPPTERPWESAARILEVVRVSAHAGYLPVGGGQS